jgi:hypothetical protein
LLVVAEDVLARNLERLANLVPANPEGSDVRFCHPSRQNTHKIEYKNVVYILSI